jgi:glyoxylase-like metal-dependent hydrolase (beta-lactamase superfamily II)
MTQAGGQGPGEPELLRTAKDAGIHVMAVPTPFLVGPVNCYLIEDEPLTLLDTGPNSGTALDSLEGQLTALGHRIEDLELIVITHQHMDHLGLLNILARRSGAEVAALHQLGRWVEDFEASAAADDSYAQSIMRRHGVPDDLVTSLGMVGAAYRPYGSSAHVSRLLNDGDVLALRDRDLRVLHRPGHSPSDTVFWDERRRILLAGDHLLARISSNALVSRPLMDEDGHRPRPLLAYGDSLRRTRELPAELVLGGHGPPIAEHAKLIDERLRLHDRRARKLWRMLGDGPLSAYEIALQMWSNVAVTQAYLTLSEVLGHLDLLIEEGTVRELDGDEVVRFEAVALPDQG